MYVTKITHLKEKYLAKTKKMKWGLLKHKNTCLSFHALKKMQGYLGEGGHLKLPLPLQTHKHLAEMSETVCTLCQSTERQISKMTLKGKHFRVFVLFSCHNALLSIQQQTPASLVVIAPNTFLCILRFWHIQNLNLLCRRTAMNSPWY